MQKVRTVLGDISAADVGFTLPHEHTMYGWNGVEFDHRAMFDFDSVVTSVVEDFKLARETFGLNTFVDCTAPDMGRQPRVMVEVSRQSGINIVAATGFFCQSMGIPYHWRRQTVEEISEFFVRDIEEGMFGVDVRCGIIKVASGQDDVEFRPTTEEINGWHLGVFEQKVFAAAAQAQAKTGVPITTHIYPDDWKIKLRGLKNIDWSRDNPQWEGRLLLNGRMLKNAVGVELAANTILKQCGIELSEDRLNYENKS